MKNKIFDLGQTVMTRTINNEIADSEPFAVEITKAFARHCVGDWGDLCKEDKQLNELSLTSENQGRLFSAYNTIKGKIYIITEWDRSATTILFANEY